MKHRWVQVALAAWLLAGCAGSPPKTPWASGHIEGQRLSAEVDHPTARYYLQHYLAGERREPALDAMLDGLHAQWSDRLPTSADLAAVAQAHSPDLAALLFARQAQRRAQGHALYKAFEVALKDSGAKATAFDKATLFVFVPGWRWRSEPATGADFQRFRTLLSRHGANVLLAEVDDNGSVEHNAKLLARQLLTLTDRATSVVVVSGSKGGPEAALALSSLAGTPAIERVAAWVNVGGLLGGTALADIATAWPVCWFVKLAILRGESFDGVRSLKPSALATHLAPPRFPESLLVINYIGVPMAAQLSERGQMGYRLLKHLGPNDGLTLLADAVAPTGLTIPHLGSDHYLQAADIDARVLALARAVTQHIHTGRGERS